MDLCLVVYYSRRRSTSEVFARTLILDPAPPATELNIGSKRVCSDQNCFGMIQHRSPAENRLTVRRRRRLEWPRAPAKLRAILKFIEPDTSQNAIGLLASGGGNSDRYADMFPVAVQIIETQSALKQNR